MNRPIRTLLVAVLSALSLNWAIAQVNASQSLVGTWLLTVQGVPDNETRTLIISSDAGTSASADLAAKYGLTSKSKTPVEAKLVQDRTPRQLLVLTQAATAITLDEQADGSFAGTFVTKSGKSYPAKLLRAADTQLGAGPQSQTSPATSPASPCASFEGRWTGTWAQGGMGQAWLWVQAPKPDCTARFAYLTADREPRGWSTGRIQDSTLSFTCNTSTGGVCTFKLAGDEMWVSYAGSMGTNSAVFKRVQR